MSAEAIVKSLLEASSGLSAIVSTRLYSDARHEGDPLPAIVWSEISDGPTPPIDSTPGSEPCAGRIQVNCLAATAAQAVQIRALAISACHKQSGTIAGFSVSSVLQDPTSASSRYDALVDTFTRSVDFIVQYVR